MSPKEMHSDSREWRCLAVTWARLRPFQPILNRKTEYIDAKAERNLFTDIFRMELLMG
jgi:hypothetical protein